MSLGDIRKFNPGLNQSDDDIVDQFVVRLGLLEDLCNTIRENTHSDNNRHLLLYGPRGRGKSMLIERLRIAVQRDSELNQSWIVVRLFEEAYYEISSSGELWYSVLKDLARTIEGDLADSIQQSCDELWEYEGSENGCGTS